MCGNIVGTYWLSINDIPFLFKKHVLCHKYWWRTASQHPSFLIAFLYLQTMLDLIQRLLPDSPQMCFIWPTGLNIWNRYQHLDVWVFHVKFHIFVCLKNHRIWLYWNHIPLGQHLWGSEVEMSEVSAFKGCLLSRAPHFLALPPCLIPRPCAISTICRSRVRLNFQLLV